MKAFSPWDQSCHGCSEPLIHRFGLKTFTFGAAIPIMGLLGHRTTWHWQPGKWGCPSTASTFQNQKMAPKPQRSTSEPHDRIWFTGFLQPLNITAFPPACARQESFFQ